MLTLAFNSIAVNNVLDLECHTGKIVWQPDVAKIILISDRNFIFALMRMTTEKKQQQNNRMHP